MINKSLVFLVAFALLVSVLVFGFSFLGVDQAEAQDVIVYKSPDCGCCLGYIEELKREGYRVKVENRDDMSTIKDQYNIPEDMESCHTSVFDRYFVEGHVPFQAVNKLLTEEPAIDGISLPDMPAGSPGMPGEQNEAFDVYQLSAGEASEYLSIK
jgi:hypothetical protein